MVDLTTNATAELLDGRRLAGTIKAELRVRVAHLADEGIRPGLGTILVGDDPSSHIYVNGKHRDCDEVGIASQRIELPGEANAEVVLSAVDQFNEDPSITGFIVQLPLPGDVGTQRVLERIDPEKDADGLHPTNLGRLLLGEPAAGPCTPRGILELLRRHDIEPTGAQVCVIGCGLTVGRPLSLMLTHPTLHATVTLCNEATPDIAAHTRVADIVISAAGAAHLVRQDWVKPGAAVLSVGLTQTVEGVLGDVHPDVRHVASHVAPAIGGVGPMTRAMLLTNVVEAAERQLARARGRSSAIASPRREA